MRGLEWHWLGRGGCLPLGSFPLCLWTEYIGEQRSGYPASVSQCLVSFMEPCHQVPPPPGSLVCVR